MEKIKEWLNKREVKMVSFIILGFIIAFDLIGGTCIPLAYGRGAGWFFVPNLMENAVVIYVFIKFIKAHK